MNALNLKDIPGIWSNIAVCCQCRQAGHFKNDCPKNLMNMRDQWSPICNRCGENGHRKIECPDFVFGCWICGGFDHDEEFCPMKNQPICFKCEGRGHLAKACKRNYKGGQSGGNPNAQNMICYRCNRFGHLARDCKSAVKLTLCYLCNRVGHLSRDCVYG